MKITDEFLVKGYYRNYDGMHLLKHALHNTCPDMIDPHYEDHPDNKASHCAKMIAEYYQKYDAQKGTQFVFSDLGTYQPGDGWNVYSEIKRKLTEDYGIPPSEVRFIQECKTDKARKAVIDAMNAGTVRVLFGSTSMSCVHH